MNSGPGDNRKTEHKQKEDAMQTARGEAVPADLRHLQARLAERGITMTLANVGPDDDLPELVVPAIPGASLSEAVLEEREEGYRGG